VALLSYSMIASFDGYVADESGSFDWAAPDEEVHSFVNDLERGIGTYLYGRGMYETMVFWETLDTGRQSPAMQEYAEIWRSAEKIVYSTTLTEPQSARTRIERVFEPDAVRELKTIADSDLSVGGPGLASHALAAGLVDELRLFVAPVVVGGGTRWLPDGLRLPLELLEERRFGSGMAYLRYRART
jgi:dihydrofolate reductase